MPHYSHDTKSSYSREEKSRMATMLEPAITTLESSPIIDKLNTTLLNLDKLHIRMNAVTQQFLGPIPMRGTGECSDKEKTGGSIEEINHLIKYINYKIDDICDTQNDLEKCAENIGKSSIQQNKGEK